MAYCKNCGTEIPPDSFVCTNCLLSSTTPGKESGRQDDGAITWCRKIPLITNYILIRDLFLAFMGAGLLVATILVIATGDTSLYILFGMVFAAVFLLCLFIMLVLQVVYGGGLNTCFFISPKGVSHQAGKEMQALNRLSLIGSVAGGSTGGTGAGLIAISQENNALLWNDVQYIRVYSRLRFIELRSKYLISPVVLYCTEKNFPAVLEKVKQYAPKSASLKIHGIT